MIAALELIAGVGAIVALTAYLIADVVSTTMASARRGSRHPGAVDWPLRWEVVGCVLVVLWLAAAMLR